MIDSIALLIDYLILMYKERISYSVHSRTLVDYTLHRPLNVLSLFSGCGGMDLGLEGAFPVFKDCVNPAIHPIWATTPLNDELFLLPKTRFKTIFANDTKESAKHAWTNYFNGTRNSSGQFHHGSIVDFVKQAWDGSFTFPSNVDIVTGGFPCQDFSNAGKRNGFHSLRKHDGTLKSKDDPSIENRGLLYVWMRHVIDIVRPNIFIAENVQALTTMENVLETIQRDFQNVGGGYHVLCKVLNAVEYGVPQTRRRVFFIGFKKRSLRKGVLASLRRPLQKNILSPFPEKTHAISGKTYAQTELIPEVSTSAVLSGLGEPEDNLTDLSQRSLSGAKYYGKHCQGNVEIVLSKPCYTIRAEHHGNIEFRRLSKAHGGKISEELDKGLTERRLTVRECARIQTFPDEFEFVISNPNARKMVINGTEGYVIVGNAVPPLLGYHLADKIQNNWNKYFR